MVRDSLSILISRPPLSSGHSAARITDSFLHFLATDGHPTRRASWDAATDAKTRKRHDFRYLRDGLYAAKQRPAFQTRSGIPEVGAVDRVDSHAKASSYSSVYAVDRNCADL